ncbi:MAG: RpiB/LacA/LacB family sugar-phosphate isomerase [Ferruginibacter sp.]|nr:RpiB/LacA/LacB family sugar-phosphate isomerase [Cytophagales bacterium]
MKVGIAADHGGFEVKEKVAAQLKEAGHTVTDFGAFALDNDDDFPDFTIPLARAVAEGKVERGVAICGSGVGASMAANKVAGVRAALITETYSAHQGVEHDDMNVICLGGRVIGPVLIWEIIQSFLNARYAGEERQRRRMAKVAALEKDR